MLKRSKLDFRGQLCPETRIDGLRMPKEGATSLNITDQGPGGRKFVIVRPKHGVHVFFSGDSVTSQPPPEQVSEQGGMVCIYVHLPVFETPGVSPTLTSG